MPDGTELIVEMPLVTASNKTREQNDVFLRIHRSFAVNVEHIDIYYNDSLIMKNEMRVPIGRLYRDILPDNLTIIGKRDRTSDEAGNEQID